MDGLPCKPSIFGTIPLGRGGVIEGGCGVPPSISLVVDNYKKTPSIGDAPTKTNHKKQKKLSQTEKKQNPLYSREKKPSSKIYKPKTHSESREKTPYYG